MSVPSLLIVKLGAIGDVVLSLPMIHAARHNYPEARITIMIGRAAAPLLENDPAIDELWIINEEDFWKKRPIALLQLLLEVRRRRFQKVFILQWSSLFHAFFWLTSIPERIGFSREGHSFRLTGEMPYYEGSLAHHDVDLYRSLVENETTSQAAPRITLTTEERAVGEAFWISVGAKAGQRRVIMAPGGGHNAKLVMPLKRWPLSYFSELAKKLEVDQDALVILAGSAEEKVLLNSMGGLPQRNVAGQMTLRQTAALISTGHLFIGNDSGLTHIAAAVDTPSLAFFGPTSPNGKESRKALQKILYRNELCSPCYRFGVAPPCPYQMKCLTQISVEQAWQAVLALEATGA